MSCATEEDVKEYFKVEEQERLKQEQAACREGGAKDQDEEESTEAQAAALKAKGNDAFSLRHFQAATQYFLQAIELDPTSHKYKLALEDSDDIES
ncbi:hypothetical protein PF005_g9813 [Phytophthora fragariae]|uniref:Uncharacterized protein n=1 Tax=Phytophthora fragariae TaxID=53985 RepID=A0A6A3Y9Z2_9STRA|nr:hypothetical protein PF005_g9813 [Phytophthora fragariae]